MSTQSKRKTVGQTPEQKTKSARRNTLNDDANQEVSLFMGGPINFSQKTMTGTKSSREDEIKWLSSLNRRLEIAIVTRSAQEQATVTQLMDKKTDENSLKHELQSITRTYGTVLAQQQNQIKNLSEISASQSQSVTDFEIGNKTLQNQIHKLKDDYQTLKREQVVLKKQNSEYQTEVSQMLESKDALNEELERLVEQNNDLVEQYLNDTDGKRSKKDDATAKITALNVKVALLEKQNQIAEKAHLDEIEKFQNKLRSKVNEFNNDSEAAQEKFDERLEEVIANLKQQHQEELEELSNQLHDQQDQSNNRLKSQLIGQKDQVLGLQEVKMVLEKQITDLRSIVISLEADNEGLISQVHKLEEESELALDSYQIDITELEQHVDDITDLFQDKENQVADLMNIKVSLQMEIDHYRKLLEAEEKRLGLQGARNSIVPVTPGTRRSARNKTTPADDAEDEQRSTSTKPSLLSTTTTTPSTKKRQDKLSSLVQTGIDFDGKYVKFHNGSTSPISLDGYTIGSDLTDKVYEFDDSRILQPNEQIIIFFKVPSKQDKTTHRTVNHFLNIADNEIFREDNANDKKGQLYDNLGRSVAKFEFLNKSRPKNRQ